MCRKKTIVYIMTVLLLLAIALTELILMQRENFPFSVTVTTEGGSETIDCWRKDGCYYVFLPSCADPEQAVLTVNPLFPVSIDGRRIRNGENCGTFPFFEELPIVCKKWGKTYEDRVYFCQSANLPSLYIDTASGSMEYIHAEMGNAESGKLRLYSPEGSLDCSADIREFNGRGNSTWTDYEKKPYSLELSRKADLLGMGAAKKWILLANATDASNINNKMAYDFAAKAGCAYTPECRWVDLYLNGAYTGLYLLSERNEVDSQRVDITKNNSFLVSMEKDSRWNGENYDAFYTSRFHFLRIHYAGGDADWIRDMWQSVEDAIFAEDGVDPATGKRWDELIDVDSWARQYLLWDVFAEFDAGALSKFFYYDSQKDRIYGGPVWDMDNILNIQDLFPANILAAERRHIWSMDEESLFYKLYQKDSFRETVKRLYREEYRPLLLALAETGMDQYFEQIRISASLNRIRWQNSDPEEALKKRRDYLLEHMAFLDAYWEAEEDYCVIEALGFQLRSYAVRRGESAEFLLTISENWIDFETGEPFDVTAPVTCNRTVQQVDGEEAWQE